jgi:hypothetical protein
MPIVAYTGLVGATIIFVWSPIFTRVRSWYPKMLACAMCVGFWVGLLGSIAELGRVVSPLSHFLAACAVSLLAFAVHLVLEWLDSLVPPKEIP